MNHMGLRTDVKEMRLGGGGTSRCPSSVFQALLHCSIIGQDRRCRLGLPGRAHWQFETGFDPGCAIAYAVAYGYGSASDPDFVTAYETGF